MFRSFRRARLSPFSWTIQQPTSFLPRQEASLSTVTLLDRRFLRNEGRRMEGASFSSQQPRNLMPTAPARRFATSRQKRSGIYQEGESKDTKLDMKSSTIDEASVSASSESPLINTRQPPPPQLLLPNTDLTSFAETPSLMRDTPYTTLEDLQRGIEIPSDDTELLHNAATPSSSSFTDLYDPNVH